MKQKIRFLVFAIMAMLSINQVWGAEVTFDLTTNTSSSASADLVTWVDSPVTASLAKGSGTAANNYLGTSGQTRMYNGNTFSVTVAEGYYLTSVVITATGNSYTLPTSGWTGGSASASGAVVTVTANTETRTVSVNPGGTKRITEIKVIYKSAAPAVPYSVTLNMDGTQYGAVLTEASVGAGVTLPSVEDCGDYTFEGWSKTNTNGTSTKPTIIKAGSYSPSANETLYAVFSKETGSSSTVTGSNLSGTTTATKLHADHPITYKISSANSYSNPLRVYSNNVVTIAGGTMSRIVFTVASGYDAAKLILQSGGGSISNGVWTGSSTSVQVKADGVQVRISSISVTYGETTTTYTSSPDCAPIASCEVAPVIGPIKRTQKT